MEEVSALLRMPVDDILDAQRRVMSKDSKEAEHTNTPNEPNEPTTRAGESETEMVGILKGIREILVRIEARSPTWMYSLD
jgi:hypothetical protein